MSAKVEGLPGILWRVKGMGMKLTQATTSAGSLMVLMPTAPGRWPPEATFPLGLQRTAHLFAHTALHSNVLKDWGRNLSLKLPVGLLGGAAGCGNGDRDTALVAGAGAETGAELVPAFPY